jgi:hypothetical protein
MMLKANNEYLDFTGDVDVEKQIKLFEEIATTDGDFSYSFELPRTINNVRILGNPMPDNISKQVYQRIPAMLLSNGGAETFKGYIRVERLTNVIECSFFAGNNNWFGMLSGDLSDIDWSEFDTDVTESVFAAAIFNTEGIVFPLVDNGLLSTRGTTQLKIEDFVPAIYAKTVFKKVFGAHGIKIQGELLEDPNFNARITLRSGKDQEAIDARSTFARTYNSPNPDDFTFRVIQFTDDFTYPYRDGSANNFNTSTYRYTADLKMRVKVKAQVFDPISTLPGITNIAIYKNGVEHKLVLIYNTSVYPGVIEDVILLEAGDYLDIRIATNTTVQSSDPITHAEFTVTPLYIYHAFGESIVPDWTQQQYVSAILQRFNVLAHYESGSKTLTFNLFEKIKSKTPIDISEHISSTEVDYTEFVSEYAKKSYLVDNTTDQDEDFRKMNLPVSAYSKGVIEIDNDFLEDSKDVLTSEFTAPITYNNPIFDMSIEKTDLIKFEEEIKVDFTGVTEGTLGRARFAVEDGIFALSDMVRIENSIEPSYNGDWMVFSIGTGWIEVSGAGFVDDSTGEVSKMNFVSNESTSVFILHHIPLYQVTNFSNMASFKLEATDYNYLSLAYYNLINLGRQINRDFIYSVSFGSEDQISAVDQYFHLTERMLNDPVKLFCTATLPYYLFTQMDFLSPVTIRTNETQNLYYINRITGYKEEYLPCTLELIKIP